MSSIDDEIVRAKMRKLRVSTFADIFYEVVNDEAYADALPEDIFLAAVEEAYTQLGLTAIRGHVVGLPSV